MALTLSQKSSVRRHLQYPVIGLARTTNTPAAGGTLASAAAGWRYNQTYGFLEYKMNNLNPDEEARLIGKAFAGVALVGPQPNPGDTMTVVLSGGGIVSPQTLTVTAGPTIPENDMRLPLLLTLAQLVAINPSLQAAQIYSLAPYGTGPYAANQVPLPECGITGPTTFTIAASGTGMISPEITADGALLTPATSLDGVTQTNGYLPILDGLEGAWASASQNLDTYKADVWTARVTESASRFSLYRTWQMQLSDFLGIPINPYRKSRPSAAGVARYV